MASNNLGNLPPSPNLWVPTKEWRISAPRESNRSIDRGSVHKPRDRTLISTVSSGDDGSGCDDGCGHQLAAAALPSVVCSISNQMTSQSNKSSKCDPNRYPNRYYYHPNHNHSWTNQNCRLPQSPSSRAPAVFVSSLSSTLVVCGLAEVSFRSIQLALVLLLLLPCPVRLAPQPISNPASSVLFALLFLLHLLILPTMISFFNLILLLSSNLIHQLSTVVYFVNFAKLKLLWSTQDGAASKVLFKKGRQTPAPAKTVELYKSCKYSASASSSSTPTTSSSPLLLLLLLLFLSSSGGPLLVNGLSSLDKAVLPSLLPTSTSESTKPVESNFKIESTSDSSSYSRLSDIGLGSANELDASQSPKVRHTSQISSNIADNIKNDIDDEPSASDVDGVVDGAASIETSDNQVSDFDLVTSDLATPRSDDRKAKNAKMSSSLSGENDEDNEEFDDSEDVDLDRSSSSTSSPSSTSLSNLGDISSTSSTTTVSFISSATDDNRSESEASPHEPLLASSTLASGPATTLSSATTSTSTAATTFTTITTAPSRSKLSPPASSISSAPLSTPTFEFTRSVYNASIAENSVLKSYAISTEKMGIYISDPVLTVRYKVVGGDLEKIFRAESKRVGDFFFLLIRIRLGNNAVLNREYLSSYELRVRATITSSRNDALRIKSKCTVLVTVTDRNDLSPFFFDIEKYQIDVREDVPLDTAIFRVRAVDPDIGRNGEIYYSLASHQASHPLTNLFAIHPTMGTIYSTRPLFLSQLSQSLNQSPSRSQQSQHRSRHHGQHLAPSASDVIQFEPDGSIVIGVSVLATDRGFHHSSQIIESSKAVVTIRIVPVNQHSPKLSIKQHRTLSSAIPDSDKQDLRQSSTKQNPNQNRRQIFAVIHVSDADLGQFGEICQFEIVSGNRAGLFVVTNQSSSRDYNIELANERLTTAPEEQQNDQQDHHPPEPASSMFLVSRGSSSISLVVRASDCGGRSTNETIHISLLDFEGPSNSNSVGFQFKSDNYYREIHELSLVGTQIVMVDLKWVEPSDLVSFPFKPLSNANQGSSKKRRFRRRSRRNYRNQHDTEDSNYLLDGPPKAIRNRIGLEHKPKSLLRKEMFSFQIIKGNENGTFGISRNGVVFNRKRLDRELRSKYILVVRAQYEHNQKQLATTMVHVDIVDDNDNWPLFPMVQSKSAQANQPQLYANRQYVELELNENLPNSSVIFSASAHDSDFGNNAFVTYDLIHYDIDEQFPFDIDIYSGNVSLVRPLDFETLPRNYLLFVRASDWGEPFRRQNQLLLNISVLDVNDHRPQFEKINCTVYLPLNTRPYTEVMTFSAVDLDHNSLVQYRMFSASGSVSSPRPTTSSAEELLDSSDRCFRLNEQSGQLELICNLRKESAANQLNQVSWQLAISATDGRHFSDTNYVRIVVVMATDDETASVVGSAGSSSSNLLNSILSLDARNRRFSKRSKRLIKTECTDSGIRHKLKHQYKAASLHGRNPVPLMPAELEAIEQMKLISTNEGAEQTTSPAKNSPNTNNDPVFEQPFQDRINIAEDTLVGSRIRQFVANDSDSGYDGLLVWSLNLNLTVESEQQLVYFEIDQFSGELFLVEPLDYELTKRIQLSVTVCDQAVPPRQRCANQTVTVEVQDVNDNPPLVENFVFNVSESAPTQTIIGTIFAVDKDAAQNSLLQFSIDESESGKSIASDNADDGSQSTGPMFSIDPRNGTLRLERTLDRELIDHHVIYVRVSDHGLPHALSSVSSVTIYVDDINDNAPQFYQTSYFVKVREDIPVGTRLTRISAFDRDEPGADSSRIRYSLSNPLELSEYSQHHHYHHNQARHLSYLSSNQMRRRNVPDPQYKRRFAEIDSKMDEQTNDVEDREEDQDDILAMFSIDELTGNIRLNRQLNYEKIQLYNLTVQATDEGKPLSLSSSTNLIIEIEDVDENFYAPKFPEIYAVSSVRENQPPGTLVTTVKAIDEDDPSLSLIYQIVGGSGLGRFMVDSEGNVLTSARLDTELDSHFWLTIVAKDRAAVPQTSSLELYIELENENDMPSITKESIYQISLLENCTIGSEILRLTAVDQDFHRASTIEAAATDANSNSSVDSRSGTQVLYRITTENVPFAIDPINGSIRLVHQLDREQFSRYVLDVEVLEPIWPNRTISSSLLSIDQSYLAGLSSTDDFHVSRTPVIVSVLDVNEYEPRSIMHTYRCYSYSQVDTRLPICQVIASDRDDQPTFQDQTQSSSSMCSMKHQLIEGGDIRYFRLDSSTGIIYPTVKEIPKGGYDFMVEISDCGEPIPLSSTVHVIIRVMAVDQGSTSSNTPPIFEPMDSILSVSRSEEVGFMVAPIKATDDDFDRVCYYIIDGNLDNSFALLDTGALVIARSLTRLRSVQKFNLTILITDGRHNATTSLVINVLNDDLNLVQPFSQANYTINVFENITVGAEIVQLRTVQQSMDESDTAQHHTVNSVHHHSSETRFSIYSTSSPDTAKLFEIESWSGKVRVKSGLDFELGKQHWLLIEATDSRNHPRLSTSMAYSAVHSRTFTKLTVNVFDVNDRAPQFILSHFESSVLESASIGTSIMQVQAFDEDFGSNGMLSYSITSGNIDQTFEIEPSLGYLYVQKSLSNQRQPEYYLVVKATDQGQPPLSGTANVHLSVTVPDNSPPKFEQQNYFIDIREDEKVGAILLSPRVITRQTTFFEISSGDPDSRFGINVNNGEIYLRKSLDYEQSSSYSLQVSAVSLFGVRDKATISITVIDINDNVPFWKETSFEGQVHETTEPGSLVLSADDDRRPLVIRAYDRDSVHNAILVYSIVEQEAREYFEIDPQTGSVSLLKHLDYEILPEYNFTVSVSDYGYPSLKAATNALVRVRCLPVNDCPPVFEQNNLHTTILLPTYSDVIVTKVSATDCDHRPSLPLAISPNSRFSSDLHPDFIFSIVSVVVDADSQSTPDQTQLEQSTSDQNLALFRINRTTGQITTGTSQLEVALYLLTVSVTDGKYSSTAKVYINAKPLPRSSLRFRQDRLYGTVPENSSMVQTVVMPTIDGNKLHEHLIFRIMNPNNYFRIARTSGAILFRGIPVDREQISKFELAIEVQSISLKNRVAHALVEISIEDINDNSPIFVNLPYSFVLNSDSEPGTFIGKVQSVDLDSGPNAEVSYSIISDESGILSLFSLDSQTGHLTLARSIDPSLLTDSLSNNFSLLVSARDHGTPLALETFTNLTVRLVSGAMPLFASNSYNVSVSESHPPLVPFATIKADSPHGRQIFYNIEMGNENEEFVLDFNTDLSTLSNTLCMVSIAEKLDRETVAQHNLLISAIDSISGASATINLYINVEDTNDNSPMFTRYAYNVSVAENLPVGSSLLKVSATDADSGLNSKLQYQLVSDSVLSKQNESVTKFAISPDDGVIYLKSSLDYERDTGHQLTVSVSDYGSPKLTSTTKVWIEVQDVNDNAPRLAMTSSSAPISIDETIGKDEFVTKVIATDRDWIDRDRLSYRILSGSEQTFWINQTSGAIYVRNLKSNRYSQSRHSTQYQNPLLEAGHSRRSSPASTPKRRYDLNISVSDGVYSTTGLYQIHLKPVNRYSPKFSRILNNVAIGELLPVGGHVFHISASDLDQSNYGLVEYYIMNDFGHRYFQVDPLSGDITLRSRLDYELGHRSFWLILAAQDRGKRLGVSALRIAVTDENDNPPRFIVDEYQSKVCSQVDIGTTILAVLAVDDDEDPDNTIIRYSIYNADNANSTKPDNSGNSSSSSVYIDDYFEISSETGYIHTRKNLTALNGKVVQFFVKATNLRESASKRPNQMAETNFQSQTNENVVPVSIQITDQCSYQKRDAFLYEVFVKENVESGSVLANINLEGYREAVELKIVGVDSVRSDTGQSSTSNAKFRIDKLGRIFVNERLDREAKSRHILAIQLTDRLSFSVDYLYVVINIMDENDCTPYFDSASYYLAVAENQEVGSSIYKINALDDDIDVLNNALHYSLNDTYSDTFAIDDNSGWLVLKQPLDRETKPSYHLEVLVSDGVHLNATSLHVEVFDVNDNPPSVQKRRYIAAILENSQLGTVIVSVEATDPDLISDLRYHIVDGDYLNQFAISSTGDVFVNRQLDREFIDRYRLRILITDGKYQTETELEIDILDVDDNGPICPKSKYVEMVSEAVPSGTYILTVDALDMDQMDNARLYFSLAGQHRDHFSIDPVNGNLQTNAVLDRETQSGYFFSVLVADDKNRHWTCTSFVEILLSDVNDESPKFLSQINSVNIPEDSPVGIILGKVTAIDLDLGENRRIRYELGLSLENQDNPNDEFMMDERTGIIRLAKSLDREQRSFYNLTVVAIDGGLVPLNSSTYFVVNVTDINDNAPEFERQSYMAELVENSPIGSTVMKIFATSKDTGINAEIGYRLVSGNENGSFAIDSKTGLVTVAKSLDYETVKEYFLVIRAVDRGVPPLSSEVSLRVAVLDVNDVRPQFVQRSYDIVIREDAQICDRILQLVAIDLDSPPNANLTYSFAGGNQRYKEFEIEPKLGILKVGERLDRESMSAYILEVFCSDQGQPPQGPLTTSVLINVEISDYNDNPPTFSKLNQTVLVQEGRPVGYIVQQFRIQDADSPLNSGPFKFAIIDKDHPNGSSQTGAFSIHDNDASLRTNSILNHSIQSEYQLTIRVTDSGTPPLNTLNWITVQVIEEPKVPPRLQPISISINSLEQFPGGVIGQANASDQDRFDKLVYGLVDPADKLIFSINPSEGTLVAFPGLDAGKYELNISVTDGRFISYGLAEIEVILLTEQMIENSLVIEFRSTSVKSFVTNHLRSFVRIVKNLFNVRSKDVFVLSVQPAERKSMRRHQRSSVMNQGELPTPEKEFSEPQLVGPFGDISLMFAVAITKGGYFTRNWLKSKLLENKQAIEKQLGLQFEQVLLKSECAHYQCNHGDCREDLVLSENEITSIVTHLISFVSPFHEYRVGCACHAGFGGKLCETTVNECARNPCPPHKECVPVSSSLGYLCQCPFGKSGASCNQNAETCHPNERDVSFCYQEFNPISFFGNSYVRYSLVRKVDKISLRFRSQQLRAKIFTQQAERAFTVLEIAGGYIQFRFDCGDGEGLIRITNQLVNDGRWHEVIVERKGNKASLVLDRKNRGAGFAPGAITACNRMKEDIYFGGTVKDVLSKATGEEQIVNGLVGCLDNVLFNGQQIPFHSTSSSSVVQLKTLANVQFSCDFRPDTGPCKSQPCLNGATCTNLVNGSYSCQCITPRYSGPNCELDQRPCDSGPCLNGGLCRPDELLCREGAPDCYQCECRAGFTGKNCQLSRYCSPSLCQNGGVCEETQIGPKCHCHSGWLGLYCQTDVDECQLSTPACFSPATCINLPGTFRCICPFNSTVPCNGEGLIASNVVSSQFSITAEEITVMGIILLLLILVACIMALCCHFRNRNRKNRCPVNNQPHHPHSQHLLASSNGKHDSHRSSEASEKILSNQPFYDSFNGGNNNFRTPTKSNNLEMCNLNSTTNNILLGHTGTAGATAAVGANAAANHHLHQRQPRPTSFNEIFNKIERVQPNLDSFNEEAINENTGLMSSSATMTVGTTANSGLQFTGPMSSTTGTNGPSSDSFIIQSNFNKKNAPIASVSPQLIDTSATITKARLSPKVHLTKPRTSRNSLANDEPSSKQADQCKNSGQQRVSLNDSADSTALFGEDIHANPNSLTNSTNHLAEGYHWDNSDIYLSGEPSIPDCPQYENASALTQLIQAASAKASQNRHLESDEFVPLLPPKMNKRGAISSQHSEMANATSINTTPAATADSNALPVSESPTLDAKIGAKLEQHSRQFLEYYLPKHAEDGSDDSPVGISIEQRHIDAACDNRDDLDSWKKSHHDPVKDDRQLFKRKNILKYAASIEHCHQTLIDPSGPDSGNDPSPRYGHVRRNGTFKVGDNPNVVKSSGHSHQQKPHSQGEPKTRPVPAMLTFKRSSLTESCDNFSSASSASSSSPPSSSLCSSLALNGLSTGATSPPEGNPAPATPSTMLMTQSGSSGGSTSTSDVLMSSSSCSSSSHSDADLSKSTKKQPDNLSSADGSSVCAMSTNTTSRSTTTTTCSTVTNPTTTTNNNNNNPIYRNIGPSASLTSFGYKSLQHSLAAPIPPIPAPPNTGRTLTQPGTDRLNRARSNSNLNSASATKTSTGTKSKTLSTTTSTATAAASDQSSLIQPFNKTTYL